MLACFVLVGCSASLAHDKLEQSIPAQLQQQGIAVDAGTVACPDGIDGSGKKSVTCHAVSGGQPIDLVVSTTDVQGGDVRYSVAVEALPVLRTLLDDAVAKRMSEQIGADPVKVDCPTDLPPQIGQSEECGVTVSGAGVPVKVTVIDVKDGRVDFTIDPGAAVG